MKISSNLGPLAQKGLLNETDFHSYTFGKAWFSYMVESPEYAEALSEFMTYLGAEPRPHWFEFCPFKAQVFASRKVHAEDVPLLVDVGGGQGYWTQQLRQSLSKQDISGRLIVQDLPHVIKAHEGIETMAYDFFTPQPIVGARFYFYKQILHNWRDEKAVKILGNVANAMESGSSKLLITDFVLPERGVGLYEAYVVSRNHAWKKLFPHC